MAYLQDYKVDNKCKCKNTDAQVNKHRLITRDDGHDKTMYSLYGGM